MGYGLMVGLGKGREVLLAECCEWLCLCYFFSTLIISRKGTVDVSAVCGWSTSVVSEKHSSTSNMRSPAPCDLLLSGICM